MSRYDFFLKLAFLAGAVCMMIVTGILIGCGHNGVITNTFVGIGSAFSAANLWTLLNNKGSGSGPTSSNGAG